MEKLPYDYIRGLIEGEGCFTFCNKPPQQVLSDSRIVKTQMPAFVLRMHERDEELLKALKNTLGLKDSIHRSIRAERYNNSSFLQQTLWTQKNTIFQLVK